MRTVRCSDRGACIPACTGQGVSAQRVSAWGVSAQGGVCLGVSAWGVSAQRWLSAQRGVSAQRGCLPRGCLPGGVCPGGVFPGGFLQRGCLPHPLPYRQNNRCLWKYCLAATMLRTVNMDIRWFNFKVANFIGPFPCQWHSYD